MKKRILRLIVYFYVIIGLICFILFPLLVYGNIFLGNTNLNNLINKTPALIGINTRDFNKYFLYNLIIYVAILFVISTKISKRIIKNLLYIFITIGLLFILINLITSTLSSNPTWL